VEESYNDAEEQEGHNDSLSVSPCLSLSLAEEGAADDTLNLHRSNQVTRRRPVRSIRSNLGDHSESGPPFITRGPRGFRGTLTLKHDRCLLPVIHCGMAIQQFNCEHRDTVSSALKAILKHA
jgi:hypothetical protein